jgi:hypothetical protein
MNVITNLTPLQLRRAADIQEKLLGLQEELNELLGQPSSGGDSNAGRKHNMSAAGRAAISAAAKARWAKYRSNLPPSAKAPKTRKMSPAGRARLAAFARERWRKVKALGKSRL